MICIVIGCTPEQAFEMYTSGKKPQLNLNNEDLEAMGQYKENGFTWEQIGELFGLSRQAALRRYKYYIKTKKVACE